jgi:hypothetical protein
MRGIASAGGPTRSFGVTQKTLQPYHERGRGQQTRWHASGTGSLSAPEHECHRSPILTATPTAIWQAFILLLSAGVLVGFPPPTASLALLRALQACRPHRRPGALAVNGWTRWRVAQEELTLPLRPATIDELRWYFEHCRAMSADATHGLEPRFYRDRSAFQSARYQLLYRAWRHDGKMILNQRAAPFSGTHVRSAAMTAMNICGAQVRFSWIRIR